MSCDLVKHYLQKAKQANHRYVIVLSGEPAWCLERATAITQALKLKRIAWVTEVTVPSALLFKPEDARQMLGQEFDAAVFDAHCGMDPDAFGALGCTVSGGGLLFLLAPPMHRFVDFDDPAKQRIAIWPYSGIDVGNRFLRFFKSVLCSDKDIVVLEQGKPVPVIPVSEESQTPQYAHLERQRPWRTRDQDEAVQAIIHVLKGHRRRPLVLTSDRGRGKSSALGIAAAELMQRGAGDIIVTAPRLSAVAAVFRHAQALLPGAHMGQGQLVWQNSQLRFIPADQFLHSEHPCELLLVDEAAAIPTPVLMGLLRHYSRIVFATTVHGYEGTGRGFAVRFQSALNQTTPGWKALTLQTPIRWASDDPLERLVFEALLLNANPVADEKILQLTKDECDIEIIDRDRLLQDRQSLSELFGLLVIAHYQTQPADLRYLLDGMDLSLLLLRYQGHVVGVALLEQDGGLDADLAHAVYENRRRVRGHLIAQTLAAYVGLEHAPQLKYYRIMRIAIHPAVQGRGLGGYLLSHALQFSKNQGADAIGASFGISPELIPFWRKAAFEPVHLGLRRNASSGMHAALVLKPLSENGRNIFKQARTRFLEHFPHMLSEFYHDLEAELAGLLLQCEHSRWAEVSAEDWRDVQSYAYSMRDYEVNAVAIWRFVCAATSDRNTASVLTPLEYEVLLQKCMQKKSWLDIASQLKLAGRKQVNAQLQNAIKKIMETKPR